MKKIKPLGYVALILGLFFFSGLGFANAFDMQSKCQPSLKTFSNGSNTFPIKFPPGGGTNSDATVKLPKGATVYSVKVDMEFTDPASEIGTPYLWVPISVANGYIAQIDTRDGFEAEIARYKVGNNPSRTFVIPGGDVWVANRDSGNVTKLSPLTGDQPVGGTCGDGLCGTDETIYSCNTDCTGNVCGDGTGTCKNNIACGVGTENCKEYKVVDSYPTGGGPRGVTGDINGFVWVGNYNDGTVVKLNPVTGAVLSTIVTGGRPYGLIADQFGYVWVSNAGAGTVQSINIVTETIDKTVPITSAPYGIGIDADGNILVASCTGATANKINGYGTATPGTIAFSKPLAGGASTRGRGIASDLNGNIWVGSDNGGSGTVYSFKPSGAQYCPFYNPAPQCNTVGVAVDFNNNVWVVPYDGNVLKLKPDNVAACTSVAHIATVFVPGGLLYNYSDMTGLRTIPKSLSFGGKKTALSGETFTICSGACPGDSAECTDLTVFLSTCATDAFGDCEAPLEIFSATAGNYTLQNLEIIYGEEVPVTIGGLVPCGRDWNDPATGWDDTADCTLCHLVLMSQLIIEFLVKLAAVAAAFFLSVAGYYYIFAGGQPEKMALAKKIFSRALIGFLIILISWIAVDSTLVMFGYIDPLENDEWYVMCGGENPAPPVTTYCGDGVVQSHPPNDAGTGGPLNDGNEECDISGNDCGSLVCNHDCTCKTEPTPGVCGVWFSGGLAGKPPGPGTINGYTAPFELMDNNAVPAQLAEWVANGDYSDNSIAFSIAVARSFDGIAIDKNTRLELWDGKNYTGSKVLDITGPAIVNNGALPDGCYASGYVAGNCFQLDKAIWTDCRTSDFNEDGLLSPNEDMDLWGKNGSCKITCTAP